MLTPRSKVRYNGNVVAAAIAAGEKTDSATASNTTASSPAPHFTTAPPLLYHHNKCSCPPQNKRRVNVNTTSLSPEQVASVHSVAQEMTSIDVAACLAQVDDLLMATPVRNGRSREVRLSLSPPKTARKQLVFDGADEGDGSTVRGRGDEDPLLVPVEIMLVILSHLPAESLGCLRRVCRR